MKRRGEKGGLSLLYFVLYFLPCRDLFVRTQTKPDACLECHEHAHGAREVLSSKQQVVGHVVRTLYDQSNSYFFIYRSSGRWRLHGNSRERQGENFQASNASSDYEVPFFSALSCFSSRLLGIQLRVCFFVNCALTVLCCLE